MEETNDERIERFLNQELTAAERVRFAADLATDPTLRRRLALHRELAETLAGNPDEERFRQALRDVDAGFRPPRGPWGTAPPWRRWGAIAAALLLLIVAAIYFVGPWAPIEPAVLAQTEFSPYPIDVFRTGDPALRPPEEVLAAYRDGRYATAAERIAALPGYADADYWRFYRAVALLGDGRGDEAIPLLFALKREQSLPGLSEAIDWYLALAYLTAGQMGEASVLLTQIADSPDHYQRAAARRLLRRL